MARSNTARLALVVAFAYVSCACGDCINQKWSMPSQTMEGSGTIVIRDFGGKLGNTTVPPSQQTSQEKIFQSYDFETMNVASHKSQSTTHGKFSMQEEVDSILNWKAGLMTIHTKMVLSTGRVQEQCRTHKVPSSWSIAGIKKMKDMETALFKCVGHHDDVDNFVFKEKKMGPNQENVSIVMDVDVDAGGLVKSQKLFVATSMDIKMHINGSTQIMNRKMQTSQDMVVNMSRAGGPTEKDLKVPAEWGDCSTVRMPDPEELLAEWERSDSPFFGHTRIIFRTLRAMAAEAKVSTIVV